MYCWLRKPKLFGYSREAGIILTKLSNLMNNLSRWKVICRLGNSLDIFCKSLGMLCKLMGTLAHSFLGGKDNQAYIKCNYSQYKCCNWMGKVRISP